MKKKEKKIHEMYEGHCKLCKQGDQIEKHITLFNYFPKAISDDIKVLKHSSQ